MRPINGESSSSTKKLNQIVEEFVDTLPVVSSDAAITINQEDVASDTALAPFTPTQTYPEAHFWKYTAAGSAFTLGVIFTAFTALVTENTYSKAVRDVNLGEGLNKAIDSVYGGITIWTIGASIALGLGYATFSGVYQHMRDWGKKRDRSAMEKKGFVFPLEQANENLARIRTGLDQANKQNLKTARKIIQALLNNTIQNSGLDTIKTEISQNFSALNETVDLFNPAADALAATAEQKLDASDVEKLARANDAFNIFAKEALDQYRNIQDQLTRIIEEDLRLKQGQEPLLKLNTEQTLVIEEPGEKVEAKIEQEITVSQSAADSSATTKLSLTGNSNSFVTTIGTRKLSLSEEQDSPVTIGAHKRSLSEEQSSPENSPEIRETTPLIGT